MMHWAEMLLRFYPHSSKRHCEARPLYTQRIAYRLSQSAISHRDKRLLGEFK